MKVLISKMFTGKFNEDSIGHEVINFFKPDNCENSFIYNTPHGDPYGKGCEINSIVLIGKSERYAYPVLAIANEVDTINKNKMKEYEEKICYGRKKVKDINYLEEEFNKKVERHEKNIDIQKLTYEVKKGNLKVPKEKIYILPAFKDKDKIKEVEKRKKELEQDGCKFVLLTGGNPQHDVCCCDGEKDLEKVIEESKNWSDYPLKKVSELKLKVPYDDNSFLNFIEKSNSEQVYTNMICKILNSGDDVIRKEFIKFLLTEISDEKLDLSNIEEIQVSKEKILEDSKYDGRMDLLIKNNKYLIVIENKIKCDLNGIFIEEEIEKSQIDKYKDYLTTLKNKDYKVAKTFIFILIPNYARLKETVNVNAVITYDKVYEFFVRYKKTFSKNKHYSEFLNALAKQSLTIEEEINRRFLKMINTKQKAVK